MTSKILYHVICIYKECLVFSYISRKSSGWSQTARSTFKIFIIIWSCCLKIRNIYPPKLIFQLLTSPLCIQFNFILFIFLLFLIHYHSPFFLFVNIVPQALAGILSPPAGGGGVFSNLTIIAPFCCEENNCQWWTIKYWWLHDKRWAIHAACPW
jgi:uncharacterized membrane protein YbhN (UPF0104 family)